MRAIPPLNLQDHKLFADIAEAKQGDRGALMTALAPAAKAAYVAYSKAAPAVDSLEATVLSEGEAEAMKHAYNVATAPFAKARGKLLGRVVANVCPFCDVGESTTLDHYLPKEHWPIYAVFTRNLVPSCASCNTRKKVLVVDEVERVRAFLHPYFDAIPTQRFLALNAVLHPNTLSLTYTVFRPAGVDAPTFRHLRSHFNKMKLAKRHRLRSLSHLKDRLPALRRWFATGGQAQVSAELTQEANDLSGSLGVNSWNVLLYETLAANPDFCNEGFEVVSVIQ